MENKKLNVYLMFGGESVEHEISIITAKQVLKKINKDKYNIYPIYFDKNNTLEYIPDFYKFNLFSDFYRLHRKKIQFRLDCKKENIIQFKYKTINTKKLKIFKKLPSPDVALMCFHGSYGESGQIQGLLEFLNIPYTGPSMKGAVYGMDKIVMKYILEKNNIPILPWIYITEEEFNKNKKQCIDRIKKFSKYPLVVKPSSLGSSIGVKLVKNDTELKDTIESDLLYDKNIIIEKFGKGLTEINYSLLKKDNSIILSKSEEIHSNIKEIYSYEEKYIQSNKKTSSKNEGMAGTSRIIPAKIKKSLDKKVQDIAKNAYKVLNGESLARIDFLVDEKKEIAYIIEINTIPGSLSFYLWESMGEQFENIIDILIKEAIKNTKNKYIKSFDTPLWEN